MRLFWLLYSLITFMMHNALTLLEKIQSLPDERIAEVEDFVDFLKHKAQKKNMACVTLLIFRSLA